MQRLFGLEVLRRLGRVSYSFYLFHGLVIIIVCDHLGALLKGLPEGARFLVLIASAFAGSVASAVLFYRLLERPYFERSHARRSSELAQYAR